MTIDNKEVYVFDNGGETYDRYTIVTDVGDIYGASTDPFAPTGYGQFHSNVMQVPKQYEIGWHYPAHREPGTDEYDNSLPWEIKAYVDMAKRQPGWLGEEVQQVEQLPEDVVKYIKQIVQ